MWEMSVQRGDLPFAPTTRLPAACASPPPFGTEREPGASNEGVGMGVSANFVSRRDRRGEQRLGARAEGTDRPSRSWVRCRAHVCEFGGLVGGGACSVPLRCHRAAGGLLDGHIGWRPTIFDEDEAGARELTRPLTTGQPGVVPALYRIGCHRSPIAAQETFGEPSRILASDGLGWAGDRSRGACQAQGRRFDPGHPLSQSRGLIQRLRPRKSWCAKTAERIL